jgi:hypothetical protein
VIRTICHTVPHGIAPFSQSRPQRCRTGLIAYGLALADPTPYASATNSCSRVAVNRCLPPVHCADSVSNASRRAATFATPGGPAALIPAVRRHVSNVFPHRQSRNPEFLGHPAL